MLHCTTYVFVVLSFETDWCILCTVVDCLLCSRACRHLGFPIKLRCIEIAIIIIILLSLFQASQGTGTRSSTVDGKGLNQRLVGTRCDQIQTFGSSFCNANSTETVAIIRARHKSSHNRRMSDSPVGHTSLNLSRQVRKCEVEGTGKVESTKAELMAAGEACQAMQVLRSTPGFKDRTCSGLGLSAEKILISASAVSHRGSAIKAESTTKDYIRAENKLQSVS